MKSIISALICIVVLAGCGPNESKEAFPTFREAFFADEVALKTYFDLDFSEAKKVSILEEWHFLGMDSTPGIQQEFTGLGPGEVLNLPHRLQAPNHNFWYEKKLQIEPGVVWINGDDGVQLWLDAGRVPRSDLGNFFEVTETGERMMRIRVVNNAMAGGLRGVSWMSLADFRSEWDRIKGERDSLFLLRKVALIQDEKLLAGTQSGDASQRAAILDEFPVLLTEPVLMYGSEKEPYLRWVSEKGGLASLKFSDGQGIDVDSEDGVFTLSAEGFLGLSFQLSQEKSNFGDFKVPAEIKGNLRKIAIWGDSQGGWDTFRKIASHIAEHEVQLSIGAGDLVNNGSEEFAYQRFLQSLRAMNTSQLPVPGNHDYDGFYEDLDPKLVKRYVLNPDAPSYTFHTFGSVAILTLDPNENFPVSLPESSDQFLFMEKALASPEWKSATWRIIALHQPPYSQGWPGYRGERRILEVLSPHFHAGSIDMVIAGHTHDYERLTKDFSGHAVTFLVVGGAGGGIEPLRQHSPEPVMDTLIKAHHFGILEIGETHFDWKVFDKEGRELDRFVFSRKR